MWFLLQADDTAMHQKIAAVELKIALYFKVTIMHAVTTFHLLCIFPNRTLAQNNNLRLS